MALPVIATLLVAFALALASPSPAQQENVLNVGKYTHLGSYDPHAGALDTLWWTGNNFYESLLDLNEDLSGPRPVLATSWTASKDGKTYTFKLREGVKFSDGTPFDSAAEHGRLPPRAAEQHLPARAPVPPRRQPQGAQGA